MKNTREKVRDLQVTLREVEAGGQELMRVMKKAADSEYAVSQKLAYEKRARRDLEVEFEVALKSLQDDQVTIASKDGSRAGLDPKPTGFRPDGGGRGSIFLSRVCGFGYPTLCGGGGGSKIPPRVTRGPRSIHFNPKMESSPTAN
jgi:hypothetical protein